MKKTSLLIGAGLILMLASCNQETVEVVDKKEPTKEVASEVQIEKVDKNVQVVVPELVVQKPIQEKTVTEDSKKENPVVKEHTVKEEIKTEPKKETPSNLPSELVINRLNIENLTQEYFGTLSSKEDISLVVEAFKSVKLAPYVSVDGYEPIHEFVLNIDGDLYGYASDERYGTAIIFKNDKEQGTMDSGLATAVYNVFVKNIK